MQETLIVVDQDDNFLGYAPRSECHQGDGLRHRAIAVIVFDPAGNLLLQQRKSALWDGIWDVTGATHPLHREGGDESYEEAAARCLRLEWNIECAIERRFAFNYFERQGERCEYEYCVLLTGQFDGTVRLNPAHGYDWRWLSLADCLAELRADPSRFTPWAHIVLDQWLAHQLDAGSERPNQPATIE